MRVKLRVAEEDDRSDMGGEGLQIKDHPPDHFGTLRVAREDDFLTLAIVDTLEDVALQVGHSFIDAGLVFLRLDSAEELSCMAVEDADCGVVESSATDRATDRPASSVAQ